MKPYAWLWAPLLTLIIMGVVLILSALGALAQPVCTPLAGLSDRIAARYGEHLMWVGYNSEAGEHLFVYAQPTRGTWTILTVAGDTACSFASGDSWVDGGIPVVTKPKGEPG